MTAQLTIVGTAGRDPELRYTSSGQATTKFGVAVNRRWQNKQTQEWEESTSWFDVVAWGQLAENVAESVQKGTRVVVAGRVEVRPWEDRDGQKRTAVELVADSIGCDLRWATAQVTRNERRDNTATARTAPSGGGYDDEPFALAVSMTDDVPSRALRWWAADGETPT